MAEKIIDKDEYGVGRHGCTPTEQIRSGFFYVERRKLCRQPDDALFARELFVKIIGKEEKDGYAEISLQELADDGQELAVPPKKVVVAEDGIIVKQELDADPELGYLVGGAPPTEDGLNCTKEALYAPVLMPRVIRRSQVALEQAAA